MKLFTVLLYIFFYESNLLQGCENYNYVLHENNQSKEIKFLHTVYITPVNKLGINDCHHIYAIDIFSRLALLSTPDNTMMNDFLRDAIFLPSKPKTKQYFDTNLSKCEGMGINTSVSDISEKIEFINKSIITIKTLLYTYGAGAAHGNIQIHHEVYNRHIGMKLRWDDIFRDKSIEKYVLERVMKILVDKEYMTFINHNSNVSAMMYAIGVNTQFDVMHFKKIGYFGIVKEGLKIQYNPYEIAPFAAGSPSLVIKKEILKTYMSKRMYEMCFGENLVSLE